MFRKEVIEARNEKWLGETHISEPVSYTFIGLFCGVLVVLIILLLFWGDYTQRQTVQGQVVPFKATLNITAEYSGTLSQLFVQPGTTVEIGEPLFEITSSTSEASSGEISVQHYTVVAQHAGVISEILIDKGQRVNSQDIIFTLDPPHQEFQVELLVPGRSMAFIEAGDKVILRYETYPYEKFGLQYGVVKRVSKTPYQFETNDNMVNSSLYYIVLVKLDQQFVESYGRRAPLISGMRLSADILLEKRSLFEWMFESLYGLKERYAG